MILYNEGLIEDEYFIAWHAQKAKTDKSSSLYDRKSEKKMRELLNDFIQWLQSAEYDDEYGDEETKDDEEKKVDDDADKEP